MIFGRYIEAGGVQQPSTPSGTVQQAVPAPAAQGIRN
jgi:hypothetical protein